NATTPVFLLSLPDPPFDRLNDMYGGRPTRLPVPANTYDGQTQPSKTILNTNGALVDQHAQQQARCASTKAHRQRTDAVAEETGKYSGSTPVHPGAARYFEEAGI